MNDGLKAEHEALIVIAKVVGNHAERPTVAEVDQAIFKVAKSERFGRNWTILPGFSAWSANASAFNKKIEAESSLRTGLQQLLDQPPSVKSVIATAPRTQVVAAVKQYQPYVGTLMCLQCRLKLIDGAHLEIVQRFHQVDN